MSAEDVNALRRKGDEAFIKGGREIEAIEYYTSALDLSKNVKGYDDRQRSKMYSARGECYHRVQLYEKAVSDCSDSLKLDRTNYKAQFRRAKAYAQLKQTEFAIADLKIVIQKDSENTQAKELLKELESKPKQVSTDQDSTTKTTEETKEKGKEKEKEKKESTKKSNQTDSEPDVTREDQNQICDYNLSFVKQIELGEEISLLSKEIDNFEAAHSMIGTQIDESAVRLEIGYTFFTVSNETGEKFAKEQLQLLKTRRAELTQKLENILDEMKKQKVYLNDKFKGKIALPEIESTDNVEETQS